MNKEMMRSLFFQKRALIQDCRRKEAKNGLKHLFKKGQQQILSFCSFKWEIETNCLNKELATQNRLYLPKVVNNSLEIYKVSDLSSELKHGSFSVLEPFLKDKKRSIQKIDLVLVPALVFDLQGNRIGYGKGFYDRFIQTFKKKALFIGIGFKEQITIKIPTTPQDQKVDQLRLF